MTEPLRYEKPTPAMEGEALAFIDQFFAAGERVVNGSAGLDIHRDYPAWLAYLGRIERGEEEGFVPSVVYFARDGAGALVGVLDIRPRLPEAKATYGHLGYAVAPAHRGRGYAGQMAAWAVRQLRAAGVHTLLAACYEDNTPSRKTLENAGFVCYKRVLEKDTDRMVLEFKQEENEK